MSEDLLEEASRQASIGNVVSVHVTVLDPLLNISHFSLAFKLLQVIYCLSSKVLS